MKRFTDTEKWSDPWFRRLSSPAKQLWGYATDRCDKTGLVELDLELVTLDVGQRVGSEHLKELTTRIEDCGMGKFYLPKFIHFQYGVLTESCPPHRPIIELVKKHGLVRDGLLYHYPNATLALGSKTRQEEDKKKTRQEGGCKGEFSDDSKMILEYLNQKARRGFRETSKNLGFIQARLGESGVNLDGVLAMIDRQVAKWMGDPKMEDYLRPETLFNETKFDSYYAARSLPAQNEFVNLAPVGGNF